MGCPSLTCDLRTPSWLASNHNYVVNGSVGAETLWSSDHIPTFPFNIFSG